MRYEASLATASLAHAHSAQAVRTTTETLAMAANVSDVFNSKRQLNGVQHRNIRNHERCSTAPGHLFEGSFDSSDFAEAQRRASRRGNRRARSLTPGALSKSYGGAAESLARLEGMELAMQRNKLVRLSMGMDERGVSSISKRREEQAEQDKREREAARAAAIAAVEAREREWSNYQPPVLPELPVRDFPRAAATGVVDGDLGWGRFQSKEHAASRAEDFTNDEAGRRAFFDIVGSHNDDMIDPRFDKQSGRRRLERAQFVEENFTPRHRFIEECLQRKVGPLPVLLLNTGYARSTGGSGDGAAEGSGADAQPFEVKASDSGTEFASGGTAGGGGAVVDLRNYRLGDNVAAALAEALRMKDNNHIASLLLANNMLHGLPGELQGGDPDVAAGGLNTSGFLNQHPRHSRLGKHLGRCATIVPRLSHP